MKEKDRRELGRLAERYMAGLTTDDEERRLARLLALPDIPADFVPLRQLVADLGAAQESFVQTRRRLAPSRWRRVTRWVAAASVAVLLVGGTAHVFAARQGECVAWVYGQEITDSDVVMEQLRLSAMAMTEGEVMDGVESQLDEMFNL